MQYSNSYEAGTGIGTCIHMFSFWGLGDTIAALPAIYSLAQREPVTVYCHAFQKPILEKIPNVRAVGVSGEWNENGFPLKTYCDSGDIFDPLWNVNAQKKFEHIWKLGDPRYMVDPIGRSKQVADTLNVQLDPSFSYDILFETSSPFGDYVIFAPESATDDSVRALPNPELHFALLEEEYGDVRWLSIKEGLPRHKCSTVQELISTIQGAKHFYGIDTGVTHIACALGVPTTVYTGPTDVEKIFSDYKQFRDFPLIIQEP